MGSAWDTPGEFVMKMCQPVFRARRDTSDCQFMGCMSTMKPACRRSCAATTGSLAEMATSVGCSRTMGVPE